MARPSFVVPVADLEHGPKTISWTLPMAWLRQILEGTEAAPVGDGEATLALSMNGRRVVVRGQMRADLVMPCARTLDPVEITVSPEIFLLLYPATPSEGPVRQSSAHARRGRFASPRGRGASKPPRGKPSSAKSSAGWSNDPTLEEDEAAEDTYPGEEIVLDGFLREFVLLELPMFPLRSDLRSVEVAAIGGSLSTTAEPVSPPVDARLAPLADIASRLRKSSKE